MMLVNSIEVYASKQPGLLISIIFSTPILKSLLFLKHYLKIGLLFKTWFIKREPKPLKPSKCMR